MIWSKDDIVKELKKLHAKNADLSYNGLARKQQPLVSAAAYHFGSYRKAIERAGIDYAFVTRRPRWSKPIIIGLIKEARRNGEDLNWSAVTKRRDELGKAAFASLQTRLFGSWDRALHAAGLDADDVNRYRKWDREQVIWELKARQKEHEPLNSGALQRADPSLHAAAVRYFGGYDDALRAAKIDPEKVRERRNWQRADVVRHLKAAAKGKPSLSEAQVRREHPAMHGAAVRIFGSFAAACEAAKVKVGRGPGK